jgi:hypothetical protein
MLSLQSNHSKSTKFNQDNYTSKKEHPQEKAFNNKISDSACLIAR